jgi:hypothetical protein
MRARPSARGEDFQEMVRCWLNGNPELLVLSRINRGGGRKDWYLIRSLADFEAIIQRGRPSDCLTVFSQPQLPYRGRAGDDSIWEAALSLLGEAEESVFGEVIDSDPQLKDAFAAVRGDEDWVEEWLTERPSATVAFGPYPPFLDPDPSIAAEGSSRMLTVPSHPESTDQGARR